MNAAIILWPQLCTLYSRGDDPLSQYSYTTYSADALIYDATSNTWSLRPDFDSKLHLINLTITDDDNIFDGDAGADEVGSDTNQTGVVTDQNGNTIASGLIYDEEFFAISGGSTGESIWIESIEIDGVHVGYLVSSPIEPNATYSGISIANNDVDDSNAASYSTFSDVPHTVDGTALADAIGAGYSDGEGDQVDGTDGNNDVIYGYEGADTIDGGAGDDYIDGGDDSDNIFLSDNFGSDTIVGGEGGVDDDVLDFTNLTQGVYVNLSSTEAGTASSGSNSATFSEIERFNLSNQNDSFNGSSATEGFNVEANGGNDSVMGGSGDDTISGGAGNDSLVGGAGNDSIAGGAGTDRIEGGTGNDTLSGGDGADTIYGQDGDDVIHGGAGADHIYDGAGNDVVYGDDGDDTIHMGTGSDTLHGGAGMDYFIANDGFGTDTIDGGSGPTDYDFLDFRGHTQSVTLTITGYEQGTATAGTDHVTFTDVEAFWMSNQADSVDGSANTGFMGVGGGGGDDTIATGSGSDYILGGDGNDSIDGNAGNDTIYGELGNDTINGGAGNDSLYGGGGADSISGGDGADRIYGGTEDDRLFGGAGNDSLYGETGDDRIEGGTGNDLIDGGDGNDRLHGEAGSDTISGGSGDDAIFGGDGDDKISGGTGSDRLIGGQGSDNIDGGEGNDYLQGDDSTGTDATHLQSGGDGGATSTEADGNDTLTGGAGHDTLHGGGGNDQLTGGAGNDFFYVSDGHDTVTDFGTGNTGRTGDGNWNNNDFLNVGEYYDSLDELRADQADDGILNQSNTRDDEGNAVDYSDNKQFGTTSSMTVNNADGNTYTYDNTGIVCFAAGTRVMTPRGEVAIEALRPGDLVNTLDHGPQPLLWVGQRHVGDAELIANEELRPVLITEGTLGNTRDLLVSRQHGMMIGADHLVRAIHLARDVPGVRIAHGKREVTYVHLFFAQHEIVFAEGIASESFYPGPTALRMLSPKSRAEFDQLLPALAGQGGESPDLVAAAYGPTARPFAKLSEILSDRLVA